MAVDQRPRRWPRGSGATRCCSFVAFLVLFPIYAMVIASLKPGNKVFDRPLVPDSFTLDVLATPGPRAARALPVELGGRRRRS